MPDPTFQPPLRIVVDGADPDSPQAQALIANNQDVIDQFVRVQRRNYDLGSIPIHKASTRTPDVGLTYQNQYGTEILRITPYPVYPGSSTPPSSTSQPIPSPAFPTPPIPPNEPVCLMVLYNLSTDATPNQHICAIDMSNIDSATPIWDGVSQGSNWGTKTIHVSQSDFGAGGIILTDFTFKRSPGTPPFVDYWTVWTTTLSVAQSPDYQTSLEKNTSAADNYGPVWPLIAGNKTDIYLPNDHYQLAQPILTRVGYGGDAGYSAYAISPDGDYYYSPGYQVIAVISDGPTPVNQWYMGAGPYLGGQSPPPSFVAAFPAPDVVTTKIYDALTTATGYPVNADSPSNIPTVPFSAYGQCNPVDANPTAQAAALTTVATTSGDYEANDGSASTSTVNSNWGVSLPVAKYTSGSLLLELVQPTATAEFTSNTTVTPSGDPDYDGPGGTLYYPYYTTNATQTLDITFSIFDYDYDQTFSASGTSTVSSTDYYGTGTYSQTITDLPYVRLLPWPPATDDGYWYEVIDNIISHTNANASYAFDEAAGTSTRSPSTAPTIPASTTATVHTPYGAYTVAPTIESGSITCGLDFVPWCHLSDNSNVVQGFTIGNTDRYLFVNGQPYLDLLAQNLRCQPDDIRGLYIDIPLSIIQGLRDLGYS